MNRPITYVCLIGSLSLNYKIAQNLAPFLNIKNCAAEDIMRHVSYMTHEIYVCVV